MWKATGFPSHRVVGQAGILDSCKDDTFVADAVGVSNEDVHAMVLGGHGDTMVPLPRYTTVSGIPITQLLDSETINRSVSEQQVEEVRSSNYWNGGLPFTRQAMPQVVMAESILEDRRRLLPCSAYLTGSMA